MTLVIFGRDKRWEVYASENSDAATARVQVKILGYKIQRVEAPIDDWLPMGLMGKHAHVDSDSFFKAYFSPRWGATVAHNIILSSVLPS